MVPASTTMMMRAVHQYDIEAVMENGQWIMDNLFGGLALRLKMFTSELFVFEAISGSEEDFIRSNDSKMGVNKRGGGELFFCECIDTVDQQGPSTLFRNQKKINNPPKKLRSLYFRSTASIKLEIERGMREGRYACCLSTFPTNNNLSKPY